MTMEKKYRLLENDTITVSGRTLYRIEALRDFADVRIGDRGGYVESEKNLSHEGDCWVYDDAGYMTMLGYMTTLGYLAMLVYMVMPCYMEKQK